MRTPFPPHTVSFECVPGVSVSRSSQHGVARDVVALQVAQVSHIFVDKKDNAKLSVYWYYFPDDVKRGRQVCSLMV